MNYYISDPHFFHANILKFNKAGSTSWRMQGYTVIDPTESITDIFEYNEFLIQRWNSHVKKEDTVYIVGDVCITHVDDACRLVERLNGTKILIRGNHDSDKILPAFKDKTFYSSYVVSDMESRVVLSHYPIFDFDGAGKNSILLYGHIHNGYVLQNVYDDSIKKLEKFYNTLIYTYNIGSSCPWMQYTPRTLDEIQINYNTFMDKKSNRGII